MLKAVQKKARGDKAAAAAAAAGAAAAAPAPEPAPPPKNWRLWAMVLAAAGLWGGKTTTPSPTAKEGVVLDSVARALGTADDEQGGGTGGGGGSGSCGGESNHSRRLPIQLLPDRGDESTWQVWGSGSRAEARTKRLLAGTSALLGKEGQIARRAGGGAAIILPANLGEPAPLLPADAVDQTLYNDAVLAMIDLRDALVAVGGGVPPERAVAAGAELLALAGAKPSAADCPPVDVPRLRHALGIEGNLALAGEGRASIELVILAAKDMLFAGGVVAEQGVAPTPLLLLRAAEIGARLCTGHMRLGALVRATPDWQLAQRRRDLVLVRDAILSTARARALARRTRAGERA